MLRRSKSWFCACVFSEVAQQFSAALAKFNMLLKKAVQVLTDPGLLLPEEEGEQKKGDRDG